MVLAMAITEPCGLELTLTAALRDLLIEAAVCRDLPEELRQQAHKFSTAQTAPWKVLRDVVQSFRQSQPQAGRELWLHELCSGAQLCLPGLPQRPPRSTKLQKRIDQLQVALDEQRYAAMVADITADELRAAERSGSVLPTARLQASFGIHVLATMAALFLFAFYVARMVGAPDVWAYTAGAVGMTCGMLLETTLYVIRTNPLEPLDKRYAHLVGDQWARFEAGRKERARQRKAEAKLKKSN